MTAPETNTFDGQVRTQIGADLVRGAVELEPTAHGVAPHRLPAWARRQIPDEQLRMAQAQPSGVRLVFRTAATDVGIEVLPTKMAYVGAPPRPDGVYDLCVDGRLVAQATADGGNVRTMDMMTGSVHTEPGPVGAVRFPSLPAGDKEITIWLPHNEITELVALHTDAPVSPAPAGAGPVWLHHGSSISQGSNAETPSATWPALAAVRAGVELVNLGFGGSALLDPFVARTMRDTPADLISVKLGINLVNADLMRLRAFAPAVHGLLDTIRDGHPDTPLLVISPIFCAIHEQTPGPAAPDMSGLAEGRLSFIATGDPADATKLTLERIRTELAAITAQRSADDPALHYLDGRELYGAEDFAELPMPDQLHPDHATHRRIGTRFADLGLRPLLDAAASS